MIIVMITLCSSNVDREVSKVITKYGVNEATSG